MLCVSLKVYPFVRSTLTSEDVKRVSTALKYVLLQLWDIYSSVLNYV